MTTFETHCFQQSANNPLRLAIRVSVGGINSIEARIPDCLEDRERLQTVMSIRQPVHQCDIDLLFRKHPRLQGDVSGSTLKTAHVYSKLDVRMTLLQSRDSMRLYRIRCSKVGAHNRNRHTKTRLA